MSLLCRLERSECFRWLYWCYTFRKIVPWEVRFIGIPKCHPITDEELEYGKRLEAELLSEDNP